MWTGAAACIARQTCGLSCPYVFTDFHQDLGQMAIADLIVAMIDDDKVTTAAIIAGSLHDTIHHCIDLRSYRHTEVDTVMRHLLMVDGVVSHTILRGHLHFVQRHGDTHPHIHHLLPEVRYWIADDGWCLCLWYGIRLFSLWVSH